MVIHSISNFVTTLGTTPTLALASGRHEQLVVLPVCMPHVEGTNVLTHVCMSIGAARPAGVACPPPLGDRWGISSDEACTHSLSGNTIRVRWYFICVQA